MLPELRRLQAVPTNPRLSHCCATPRSPTRCPAALGSHVSAPWGQAGSAGLPCLSCSWCCRQQEEDGPRGYTSRWPLLPTPTPPPSFQPQGEELELARSQCQRETQSSTGGGDRTKTFMYVKGKRGKKKKRYLNKTALSLFSALPLLLEGFLLPDGDTPRRGWSTHTDEHPGEIPAVGHRDGHCAPPPRTERHCPLPLRRGKRWSFAPSSCSVLEKLCRKCAHC